MMKTWVGVAVLAASVSCLELRAQVGDRMAAPADRPVPPNFVSISSKVGGSLQLLSHASYAQLLRNLKEKTDDPNVPGPVVRVGGLTADKACFDASYSKCGYNITQVDLDTFINFTRVIAKDVNVKMVIGVDFGLTPDPHTVALAHVKAITASNMWDIVDSIEIGNEVNLYSEHPEHGSRNASYTFADYMVEFKNFVDVFASEGGLPPKKIHGAVFGHPTGDWGAGFPEYLTTFKEQLGSISIHQYANSFCNGDTTKTVTGFAQSYYAINRVEYNYSYAQFIEETNAQDIPFWNGEGNSAACGGIPNVSDTFASALWALDYLPYLAKAGAAGMNLHGGAHDTGSYSPIDYGPVGDGPLEVRPLYYGLLFFAEFAANKAVWLESVLNPAPAGDPMCMHGILSDHICCEKQCGTCDGAGCESRPGGEAACCGSAITAANKTCASNNAPCYSREQDDFPVDIHAVFDATKNQIRILLISKDLMNLDETHNVTICSASATHKFPSQPAKLIRLTAPSYTSTFQDDLRIGGQTFVNTTTGFIEGERVEESVASDSQNCYTLTMPYMSAAMLFVSQ